MSFLLHDEFNDATPIVTTIRIQHQGVAMPFLRTHCFKNGTITSGDFTCTISQSGTDLAVATITAAEINSITATYAHGMFTWRFPNTVFLRVLPESDEAEYTLTFESSGYASDSNNFFAICKDFDNVFVAEYGDHLKVIDETPEQLAGTTPYGVEIYEMGN